MAPLHAKKPASTASHSETPKRPGSSSSDSQSGGPGPASASPAINPPSRPGSSNSNASRSSVASSNGPANRLNVEWMLIGFRVVSEEEADCINSHLTLTQSDEFGTKAHRLGLGGKSLGGKITDWHSDTANKDWFAFILADTKHMFAIGKFWIPLNKHFSTESRLQDHIRTIHFNGDKTRNAANTLRFGLAPKPKPQTTRFDELYIPHSLLADQNGNVNPSFSMYAEAFRTREEAMAGLAAMKIKDKECDYNTKSWNVLGKKI